MKIKGTQSPACKLCQHAHDDSEKGVLVCTLTNEETCADNSCKKFAYDIFKYQPRKRPDFSKFSKEDFEL